MLPTVGAFKSAVKNSFSALVFDADVEQQETICINTASGAVLTGDKVLDALRVREQRRNRTIQLRGQSPFRQRAIRKRHREEDRGERAANANESRGSRREIRRCRAAREQDGHPFNMQPGPRAY